MKALLINTCGLEGIAGLAENGAVLVEERLPGRGASESLIAVIRGMLEKCGWRVTDLDVVGVVRGPGSFTGVRVGLSAAKGVCEAVGAKLVAMSRLELLADASETAVLNGGRGEFYYRLSGSGREGLGGREEVLRAAGAVRLVTCERQVVEALPQARLVDEPGGTAMLRVVEERARDGAWSDVGAADANYLRRTDAELLAKMQVKA